MIQPAILSSGLRVVPLAILDEEAGTQHAGKRHRTTTLQKPASSRLKYVRTASEERSAKKAAEFQGPEDVSFLTSQQCWDDSKNHRIMCRECRNQSNLVKNTLVL